MWEHMYVSDFFPVQKNHNHGSEAIQKLGICDTPTGVDEQFFMSACLSSIQNQDFPLP